MMVAPEVDGLVGFAIAEWAFETIHRQFINNSQYPIYAIFIIQLAYTSNPSQVLLNNMQPSTIDLHNIKDDIYLGFLAEQPLLPQHLSHQLSFFGGQPLWLTHPAESQQKCRHCNVFLCFLGQIYCPFDAQHCYHRILYFLFCSKCNRQFRCIRQQAKKSWVPSEPIESNVRKICEGRSLQNDSYSRNQFIKLQSRLKAQIEEQEAIQEAESEDEEDAMNQVNNIPAQQLAKCEDNKQQQEIKQELQQKLDDKKDQLFQVYKKAIVQLDCPCVIYTDTPLPYNKRPLNPQHFCTCGSKLLLEVQITQKILLNLDNDPNSRLLLMDWGSIFVYTCSASCLQSSEEQVVVQYQIDAVSQEDLRKLNKNKRNKKKKEQKEKSKSKSKSKSKDKEDKERNEEETHEVKEQDPECENKKEEGDWD